MTAMLGEDFQLTLPKEIWERSGFKAGTPFEVMELPDGLFIVPSQAGTEAAFPRPHVRRAKCISHEERERILEELCGSIDDPTMVAPPELPWELDSPRVSIE